MTLSYAFMYHSTFPLRFFHLIYLLHLCSSGASTNDHTTGPPPNGMCLEKLSNEYYIHLVPHPDGSDRVFVAKQEGVIWLANVPQQETGKLLLLEESQPFLNITDKVLHDAAFGLVAIAFHPNFAHNGRFFVSFYCSKVQWDGCVGRCSCCSEINCDPSKLVSDNGIPPCQYHSVILEFTANGSASQPSLATRANPSEVRRIFTRGLPFSSHHAGQILFGPDGYLYYLAGDGGSKGDPYNFAQNKKSLLGKVMRLDVDNVLSTEDINELDLWGNYSIPVDNPFSDDKEFRPEIWAFGFRNTWRCSFDSEKPFNFFCADSGQEEYEEVDIITKGGNYGWRFYEGAIPTDVPLSLNNSVTPIFPVMGYNHSNGSASIIGGYVYRSSADPCMYGRYLYADLYGSAVYAGTETPVNSGKYSSIKVPFACARDSAMQCSSVVGSSLPEWGYVVSFGEDNRKDIYMLTMRGVYRVVRPSRCNYACSKEIPKMVGTRDNHSRSSHVSGSQLRNLHKNLVLFCVLCYICWL